MLSTTNNSVESQRLTVKHLFVYSRMCIYICGSSLKKKKKIFNCVELFDGWIDR